MIHLTLGALLAFRALAQSPELSTHLNITFNGNPSGEYDFSRHSDGAFTSKLRLTIGTIKIGGQLDGKFDADGKLVEYQGQQESPQGTAKLQAKDGKVTVTPAGGKPIEVAYDTKSLPILGNLHPGFTSSLLKSIDFAKKETQKVKAYVVDGGSVVEPKVTPLGMKSTPKGSVRQYRVAFGMASVDYSMTTAGEIVAMDVPGQKLRMLAPGWDALFVDPFAKYPELSQPTLGVKRLAGQKLKTRDGVELVQEVYVPEGKGPFPVILSRTPYGRESETVNAETYVKRGYAFVAQDCRGRNDSDGEWDPFVHELNDGYDTIDWIAKQPWCDGNVGMIGASYGGFVQWAAAASHHPALKCIVPQVSPPADAMRNLPYDYGIFFLYGDVWWGKIVRDKKADMSTILATLPNPKAFTTLPLSKVDDEVLGHDVPFYNRWLERTTLKDWRGWNFYNEFPKIGIPALHISGWFDGDEIGTNLNWDAMRGKGNQWLIYGPWTHFFNSSTKIGDTEFGEGAMIDLETLYVRWFDTWLKHKDVGLNKIPKVQAFVMGENRWATGADWPLPQSKSRSFYLSASGDVHGKESTGRLLDAPVKGEAPTTYTYDPAKDEVPASILNVNPDATSFKADEALKESMYFRSDPMPKATTITGPFEVELSFSSSAQDTDFYVSLLDVDENGGTQVIGSPGKIRASYLRGLDRRVPLTPGKTYIAKLRPWDSALTLRAGHRLGILIRSSMFPTYARNLGTVEPIATGTKIVPQTNTIFHDSVHPSRVTVRVIE